MVDERAATLNTLQDTHNTIMATLTELSSKAHTSLKVAPGVQIKHAEKQHVMHLQAAELANAATSFPVFISRNANTGAYAFSAMTSFEINQNLFVQDGKWQGVFQPKSLRTFPLFLMQSKGENKGFTVGFDAESNNFSETEGTVLFEQDGKASQYLSEVTRMLESDISAIRQSYEFAKTLEEFGLLKEIDIQVQYAAGPANTIKGLMTINEEALQSLSAEKLASLAKSGYLMPIHALLMSLFNLNVLVNKNNAIEGKAQVSAVKMEVSKEFSPA